MATTEHILKLRAVLDTSDVQAQINSLPQGGVPSVNQLGSNMDNLNKSMNNLNRSAKDASDSLQSVVKVGALLAAAKGVGNVVQSSAWVEEEDMSSFNSALKGAGMGAIAGMIGGPLVALIGALIGSAIMLLVDSLGSIVNSSIFSDLINNTKQEIPMIGESLGGILEKFKDIVNTYSNDAKKKLDEENKRIDEMLKSRQVAKKNYETKLEDVQEQKFMRGVKKMSDKELIDIVGQGYKSRKAYEDLFDKESEAYKEIAEKSKGGDLYVNLMKAIDEAEKKMNKDIKRAQEASKNVEERYESEWETGFGPMTNFSKMGMNLGENEITEIQNKQLNTQEQELDVIRRIYDKIARGERWEATFQ